MLSAPTVAFSTAPTEASRACWVAASPAANVTISETGSSDAGLLAGVGSSAEGAAGVASGATGVGSGVGSVCVGGRRRGERRGLRRRLRSRIRGWSGRLRGRVRRRCGGLGGLAAVGRRRGSVASSRERRHERRDEDDQRENDQDATSRRATLGCGHEPSPLQTKVAGGQNRLDANRRKSAPRTHPEQYLTDPGSRGTGTEALLRTGV